jgi:Sap, sulfolipid-1-addressing protein
MSRDLADVFLLSLVALAYPTLLAAVTVMLLLPNPRRLMLGYLLGAYLTSLTSGLLIAFTLHDSAAIGSAHNTLSPAGDIAIGAILVAVGVVLGTGRDERLRRRHPRKGRESSAEATPWLERLLSRGSARVTFAVGALLTFPGVAYLSALNHIAALDPGVAPTILLVAYFCVMQMMLLELPLLGYVLAPQRTQDSVLRFRRWLGRRGRHFAAIAAAGVGGALILRGLLALLI